MDEGMLITEGVMKGLDKPVALVGLAETAIGMLSEALSRLERNQMPASIGGVAEQMFDTLAPEMRAPNRVSLSNLWLFGPLVKRIAEEPQLERLHPHDHGPDGGALRQQGERRARARRGARQLPHTAG
jgi:hypothetical protein